MELAAACAAGSPLRFAWEPEDRRRRRRRVSPPRFAGRVGWGGEAGSERAGAASGRALRAGVSAVEGLAVGAAGVARRRRRRRDAGEAAAVPSGPRAGTAAACRWTLAPTSPAAQRAPSAVCTSTRQTATAVAEPPTGGRFWVRVHRAYTVSPARTGRGNFQFVHSHSATAGTGMSIDPSPIATAMTRAGAANLPPPRVASTASGEKSPATAANSAISDSEMVRRRVVHSPPRGRSSKEVGSRSGASIAVTSPYGPVTR